MVYTGTNFIILQITMAKNTSVELGDEIAEFVSGQVSAGRYGSASEVVRAGLRLTD